MPLPLPAPDRTALVTGASSGIGAEIARELARRSRGVTLVARRAERLKALADELSQAHKVRAEVLAADLSDADARAGIADELAARGLTADILVNNAGLSTTGPVYAAQRGRELAMIRTDVEAVVDLCTLFLPGMAARRSGAILNVASTAAYQPLPGQAGYGASKAFVLSYSQALQGELRGTGVTVTVLCPGPVKTEFEEVAGFGADVDDALPSFMWVPAAEVAAAAVDGLERGRSVVIPGPANAVAAQVARLLPRRVLVPIVARQHPALKGQAPPG
ncbi:MAG TPA: SDR family oxidoreductase [Acidimicrobiales bacterium]|nr:SDR family oxidoreductase [Acidimicrobiales bacterium]